MKIAEYAKNLRERNNDIDKMLLVCLMLEFKQLGKDGIKEKYGFVVANEFNKYLE